MQRARIRLCAHWLRAVNRPSGSLALRDPGWERGPEWNGGANGRRPDPGRTQAATCHAEGQRAVVTEARGERPLPRTFADQGAIHPRHRAGRLGGRAQFPTGDDRRDRSRTVGADDWGERCLRHARRRETARAPSGRSPKSAEGFRGQSLEYFIRCPAPDRTCGVDREGPDHVRRGHRAVGPDTDARVPSSTNCCETLVAIPLVARGHLVGVQALGLSEHHAFTAEEETALHDCAEVFAFAISNANMYEEERRLRALFEAVGKASLAIAGELELSPTLQHIVDEARRVRAPNTRRLASPPRRTVGSCPGSSADSRRIRRKRSAGTRIPWEFSASSPWRAG